MRGCAFSLGLGEPNLAGKPVLEPRVRPHELHALKLRVAPEPKTGLDFHWGWLDLGEAVPSTRPSQAEKRRHVGVGIGC
ncbi:hypothetical protein QYE76_059550 [Lolium multiflorum]|uniref:Uncharacterized protein n=1 Tax=Lolium multiflorum TaxID=4521 RepID=A0AAD8RY93_LOLMU|nr:hypothetical protein QYE76_059530 [Lolium multiflorum]KAK1641729.1 hypothetical protein QYE76_059534 [Lolium multiflorum]KAK1641732.1 hypothetical protein QYE76_059537 [Lolium multiflorum]KAK1641735.1 hypothetical protein QYE76_059540 [Lolium multiflorum]KAK1641738.1 hypothetical protein QYE76_059543 [Lolium multiflorum]